MAKVLNGDAVIKSVRLKTTVPDDTSTFTDQDILNIIDEEMDVEVLEKLIVLHGDNLTVTVDIPKKANGSYEIPYRAIGNKLRDVSLVSGSTVFELSQVSVGSLSDFTNSTDSSSYLDNFYVQNNQIKIVQQSRAYDSIRMSYYLSPNTLTKQEEAGIISAITSDDIAGTTTLTLTSVGKNFAAGLEYDIVGYRNPNKIKGFDIIPTTVTTGTSGSITFNTTDIVGFIDDVMVGDFVTLAQETPVANIPKEMHPLIAQSAAIAILESLTDTEALKNAQARMAKMTKAVQTLIDSRVELAPKKIRPRHGTLNSSLGNSRRNKGNY